MWDLPGAGIGPVSLGLAGGFSTTGPPGKPLTGTFFFLTGTFLPHTFFRKNWVLLTLKSCISAQTEYYDSGIKNIEEIRY